MGLQTLTVAMDTRNERPSWGGGDNSQRNPEVLSRSLVVKQSGYLG